MEVRVRLFGYLAERAGRPELTVEAQTAGEALARVRKEVEVPRAVRIAVNTAYVQASQPLRKGDVVSLIPPVAGG